MPYVNIPQSKLVGGIAKLSGKMLGELSNKVVTKLSEVSTEFRRQGCPSADKITRLRSQKQGLERALNSTKSRLDKIKQLPNKIEAPIGGLEAAIRLIKLIPIPQAVPPGIGIPVSITTKYADLLHLLKELVAQAKENVEGIVAVTDTPNTYIDSLTRILSRLDGAIKACETEAALKTQVSKGVVSINELKNLGIVDEDEVYIFSKLGPSFVGQASIDSNGNIIGDTTTTDQINIDSNGNITGDVDNLNSLQQQLQDILRKLQDSSIDTSVKDEIRKLLSLFNDGDLSGSNEDPRFFYTGPNGINYKLEIVNDPESPNIAPRRFAIARDPSGVAVLKGQKSFSSSIDILLSEIKFRIDNQLS